jgi:polyhydroxyalkanoate synthase subunit PhaC
MWRQSTSTATEFTAAGKGSIPQQDRLRSPPLERIRRRLGAESDGNRLDSKRANGRRSISAAPEPGSALNLDRFLRARLGHLTFGLSPAGLLLVYLDWLAHVAISPGKHFDLARKMWRKAIRFALYAARSGWRADVPLAIEPLPQDARFNDPDWQRWPFNLYCQSFLFAQQWLYNATNGVRGVSPHHEQVLTFVARQWLDVFAPTNFVWTNPEVVNATISEKGANFIRGFRNLLDDRERILLERKPAGSESYPVGKTVAVTPGKVVYRNRLIELIQYAPTTTSVHAEPVLIVPAWIMKYYILDLSQENSLVKYLVDQGHTVFIISWKNPGPEDRDLGMEDYRTLGLMEALMAVSAIVPEKKVHLVGYCIGGTLSVIGAAAMERDDDHRLASLTLFTTETDFTEPGELALFIDDAEVTFLEDLMWDQGFLGTSQMVGAFQLLRSNDLIWSRMVREYLLGEREEMSDLMAWNADGTRLPYRMHSEYLRKLFLRNDLAEGRYPAGGRPVALADISVPIFAVSTMKDHVAPWRSVYKLQQLVDTEVTFVLATGGHNAGIISEPGHRNRSYQIATHREGERHLDADTWQSTMPHCEGSWWPAWQNWLTQRSTGRTDPPAFAAPQFGYFPLGDAPGTYVLQE